MDGGAHHSEMFTGSWRTLYTALRDALWFDPSLERLRRTVTLSLSVVVPVPVCGLC